MDFTHLIIEDWLTKSSEALTLASLREKLVHDLPDLTLSLRFNEVLAREKTWLISLRNKSRERREINLTFLFPVLHPGWKLFLPSGEAHPSWKKAPLRYGYRDSGAPLSMPMGTIYQPEDHRGYTFFGDFTIPIQRMSITCDHAREPANLRIARTHLRIEVSSSIETSLSIGEHEGDWRPGLKLIRDKYPDFFFTRNPDMQQLFGAFVFSTGVPPEDYIRRWRGEGVTAVEVHYTYPFLCKFISTEEPFVRAMDDVWSYAKLDPDPTVPKTDAPYEVIKSYLDRTALRDGAVESIREYIQTLHKYGIKGFIYFQPSEPWERFARKYFPEYLIRDAHGDEEPVWYENSVANPFPEGKFGQYIIDQFHQLLGLYPEIDGVFMDEACYDQLDFSQDDGFSIENGRPAYRMGYAICKLTQQLCKVARDRGKMIWWNGPYQIEIAHEADGLMAEGGGIQGESIQYLTIGNKPTSCLVYNERQLKRNLVLGLLPTSPSFAVTGTYRLVADMPRTLRLSAEDVELHRRYFPLFEHFKGKTWVLTPQPLSIPTNLDGNIFQTPSGDYLVTLVSMEQGTNSRAFMWDLPVLICVPDAGKIQDVCLRFAESGLCFRLRFERSGEKVSVSLPQLRSAATLFFRSTMCPNSKSVEDFPKMLGEGSLELYWEGRPGVVAGKTRQVKIHCVNNSDEILTLTLTAEAENLSVLELNPALVLSPHQHRETWITVKGEKPGRSRATLIAKSGVGECNLEIPIEVWADSFSEDGFVPILSANLRFDMFTPDGAPDMRFIDEKGQPRIVKDRAVFLNGQRIGSLPSRNNSFWRLLFTVPVPEDLLVFIARKNAVAIHPDSPEDAFKVRNISLELELVNGVRLSSTEDTRVYSSTPGGFSEGIIGNPIQVNLDFDRLDRQARRYDDWNRAH